MRNGWRWLRWALVLAVLLFVANRFFGGGAPGVEVRPGSALVVELAGDYLEAPSAPVLARLLGERRRPFISALQVLRLAERDDRIDTVVVRVRALGIGWGKAQELHSALQDVRKAGRKTVAVLELEGMRAHREYYVASAAEEVFVHPGGGAPMLGLSAEYLHLGASFERIGVEFEIGQAGRYKSAVEQYANREMSEPAREMTNSLLDSIQRQFVEGVAASREIPTRRVLDAIDAGATTPAELAAFELVDGSRTVRELLDSFDEDDVVWGDDYVEIDPSEVGFEAEASFALVYAAGTVVTGEGSQTTGGDPVVASDTVARSIREAADDDSIDAIVLRVDSPGGSAFASEIVWRAIERARRESGKPIVASFSDLAASGGYYVSAPVDAIVSNPGTLTGSIGVWTLKPNIGGALEKLDVGVEPFQRGPHADLAMGAQPLSEASRARLQSLTLETYRLFLERVADGREMDAAAVDAVAQGRVWTGAQALQAGLIDGLGGLRAAVAAARAELGMEEDADVALVPFPKPPTLAEQLADALQVGIGQATRSALPLPEPALRAEALARQVLAFPSGAPLAMLPFQVEIR